MQMPDRFPSARNRPSRDQPAPERGYGAGCVFQCSRPGRCASGRDDVRRSRHRRGPALLGWRDVPTDDHEVGPSAVAVEPVFKQIFIGRAPGIAAPVPRSTATPSSSASSTDPEAKPSTRSTRPTWPLEEKRYFYVVSLSSNTLIYKGMLTANTDLHDVPGSDRSGDGVRPSPLVHQRSAPKTFPSWPLAPPTVCRSQRRDQYPARQYQWMKAREALLRSDVLGHERRADSADHP